MLELEQTRGEEEEIQRRSSACSHNPSALPPTATATLGDVAVTVSSSRGGRATRIVRSTLTEPTTTTAPGLGGEGTEEEASQAKEGGRS
jgi:hypothetical protein